MKEKKKGGCLTAIIIVLGIGAIGSCFGNPKNTEDAASTKVETTTTTQPLREIEPIESTADQISTTDTTEDNNIPTEYKSALKKGKTYSDLMHMSKQGIYEQLSSEFGDMFSAEAAQYAVDNIEADWNANALEKAKTYSDTMHISKLGIYDQLVSEFGEQFTPEEAQYAIDNVNADWNANALEKAKDYQNSMNMSPAAIHEQLTSEYGEKFTQEEADYAISNLD